MPIFRGAIFDVDGVLINSPHEEAWRQSLHQLIGIRFGDIHDPDDLVARGLHVARLPRGSVRRAANKRRPRRSRVLSRARCR